MTYRDLIIADGPALYWPLDATYGVSDQSGNGRNGAGAGGVTIGGYAGSPISGETTSTDFDGTGDSISSSYTGAFVNGGTSTISGWAWRDASADHDALFGTDTDSVICRLAAGGNDVQYFPVGSPTFAPLFTFAGAWPGTAQWVHWALISNETANTAELYVNGTSAGGPQTSAYSYLAASNLAVGIRGGASDPFDGKMAHVALYLRALTASEIQSHYRAGVGRSTPTPIRVRQPPPLRVHILASTPNGNHFRWAEDERRAENNFNSLSFSTVIPGGFEQMDCELPRKMGIDYQDLTRLSTLTVLGAGGEIAGEFRLEKTPRDSGDSKTISPQAVGWQANLDDDTEAAEVYVDRDLQSWGNISNGRREYLHVTGTYQTVEDASTEPDAATGVPSLILRFNVNNNESAIVETLYDAGPARIGSIYYDFVAHNDSATFFAAVGVGETDAIPSPDATADLIDAANDSLTGTFTPTNRWRYGFINFGVGGGAGHTDGDDHWARFRRVTVWGNHGLTKQGTAPNDGLYASDVIANAVGRWAPFLHFTTGSTGTVKPSAFVVPQLSFTDFTTAAEILKSANRFELYDWAVWDGGKPGYPTFHYHPRGDNGRRWRARVSPAHLTETGPQVDRLWNGVIVTYQDVDGSNRTVGPPQSLADATDASLADTDPLNPVNALGLRRYGRLDMGIVSTSAAAIRVGARFLEEAKQLDQSGTAELVGHVTDDHGVTHPAWKVRAGDMISFVDAADPSYRRIIRTQYEHDSRTNSIDLDSPPEGMDALLETLGVSLMTAQVPSVPSPPTQWLTPP